METESQNVFKTCLNTHMKTWIQAHDPELKESEGGQKRLVAKVPMSSETQDSAFYSSFPTF